MSDDTIITIDTTELSISDSKEVSASTGTNSVTPISTKEISSVKKEYSIIGDTFYASVGSDVAPDWLTNLIDGAVSASVADGLTDYNSLVQDVRNAIESIDVAENTYVQTINFSDDVNGLIGTQLDTLNVTNDGKYATVANLDIVKVGAESALATQATDLQASFTSDIDSRITQVNTAFAAGDKANADSITALSVAFVAQESSISATADAVTGLQTFVGLDPDLANPGVISESTWFVDLYNQVNDPVTGVVKVTADLAVSSKAYTDSEVLGAESNFAYDTVLNINGVLYEAGFGLDVTGASQIGTDGTTGDPIFNSKFRVNAETFILTNPAHPGVEAKLTVTADGLVFDGNQIVDGTITSEALATGIIIAEDAVINGSVRGGKTSYGSTAPGYWLGRDGTDYKMHIGDSDNYLKWDGSSLQVVGDVSFGRYTYSSTEVLLSSTTTVSSTSSSYVLLRQVRMSTGGAVRFQINGRCNRAPDLADGADTVPQWYVTINGGVAISSGSFTDTVNTNKNTTVNLPSGFNTIEVYGRAGEDTSGGNSIIINAVTVNGVWGPNDTFLV